MAEGQGEPTREVGKPPPSRWKFWVGFVVMAVMALVGVVLTIKWIGDSNAELEEELNDRYVEKIEVKSQARGGGGYTDVIVIDGMSRYDCSEEDAVVTCSEDPQPTEE